MTEPLFKAIIIAAAAVFTALFAYWCIPPQIANPDIVGAFAAGFVNPYASGYSADTIACWVILSAWDYEDYGDTDYGQDYGITVDYGDTCVIP